ncbi:hypothetical protein C4565_05225 [Candidatus Parcubacteria bacterium]|nr:MAG: hypothetical protein C4565_05225 [Candidatus Parcubacteria bacterium]
MYIVFRLALVVGTSATRTIPFDLNDHYAYAVKNSIVKNDFLQKNTNLKMLKNALLAAQVNSKPEAMREFHQIFCFYHPLYTLIMEIFHEVTGLEYKRCLFIMQGVIQVLIAGILLLLLLEFRFSNVSICGFFLISSINMGMGDFFLYGMPKNYLPFFAFMLAWLLLKFSEKPLMATSLSCIIITTAAFLHIMAYAFVAIPVCAILAYGFFHNQKKNARTGIFLLVFIGFLGTIHKVFIINGILPGYMSNFTPYADLSFHLNIENFFNSLLATTIRMGSFSLNPYYYIFLLIGIAIGIVILIFEKRYSTLWMYLSFNIIPIACMFFLPPPFSFRLLPMALLIDIALMCKGYYYIFMFIKEKLALNSPYNEYFPALSMIILVVIMNFLELKTTVTVCSYALFGQGYDVDSNMQREFFQSINKEDVIGVSGGEFILLPSIYNGLYQNPVVYQRYYDEYIYPKKKYINEMTYCLGMVPWYGYLGRGNAIKLKSKDTVTYIYDAYESEIIEGIRLQGKNINYIETVYMETENEIFPMKLKQIEDDSIYQFVLSSAKKISGKFRITIHFSKKKKLIEKIIISRFGVPSITVKRVLLIRRLKEKPNNISVDWDILNGIILNNNTYNWKNFIEFGKEKLTFDVVRDDGFSFIGKTKR